MNRFEVLEAAVAEAAQACGPEDGRRRLGLLGMLRDASLTIDALWHSALRDGSQDVAMQLGEASQAVHRALIALSPSLQSA